MYKKIAISIMSIMLLTWIFSFGTSYAQFAGPPNTAGNVQLVHPERFDAAQIYRTNNMTVIDPSIRNLAIIIPDNAGSNRSTHSWPTFLPASATIGEGMRVLWFNADVNATHNIVIRNSTGATINSASVPYQNASVYRFGHIGQYTFSDPSIPGQNGTINVVAPTSFNGSFTNTSGTVGLFVVPAAGKSSFDLDLNRLGFRALSSFNFTSPPATANNSDIMIQNADNSTPIANGVSNAKILYVWSQETSGIHTTITRIASKVRVLEEIIYPHNMVKTP